MFRRTCFTAISLMLILCMAAPVSFAQRRRLGPKARAAITIGSGTAIGAGIGALVGGGRGAGIGALLGGGGTAAAYLIGTRRNRHRDHYRSYNRGGYDRYYGRSYNRGGYDRPVYYRRSPRRVYARPYYGGNYYRPAYYGRSYRRRACRY